VRTCVYGAGSIGCYVGGRLVAGGADVVLIGRERQAAEVAGHGLRLTDWQGTDLAVPRGGVRFETSPKGADGAGLVLVCVKSAATAAAAAELAEVVPADAIVVSFQNGIGNTDVLRAGLVLHQHDDMPPVQWAKLLLNLNNPVNALSGLPLKAELSQRGYRRCLALAQAETIRLLAAAGIKPARLTPLPPKLMPRLLGVPDALFARLARRMLAIDPHARTSMLDDLEACRLTEIDYINGDVVRLAESLGRSAPVNAKLVALVHQAESGGRRQWSADDLYAELRNA
jgi:2-dehydropantoate 2-reductase